MWSRFEAAVREINSSGEPDRSAVGINPLRDEEKVHFKSNGLPG
jgi:hypothetical protein